MKDTDPTGYVPGCIPIAGAGASYDGPRTNQAQDMCATEATPRPDFRDLPSRWQLQERLNKLRVEAATVEACLRNWTDETDDQLRFFHNLRVLGYRV